MSVAEKMPELGLGKTVDGALGASQEPAASRSAPVDAQAYVIDDTTGEAISTAFQDQGILGHVGKGGVAAAIEALAKGRSPQMLIVDLSNSDSPMAEIDGLAEVCEPGTSVIAVGEKNDVSLFRELIAAGVADYLVKPVTAAAVVSAITSASAVTGAEGQAGDKKVGRVVVVIGARGGVGASTVALNCAWMAAHEQKKRVALVDLDLQFGSLALALDVEPGRGLREALENPGRIDSLFLSAAAVNAGENLFVLGAEEPLDTGLSFEPDALVLLLQELAQSFDTVIIDVPRGVAVNHWSALAGVSCIALVSDMSLTGMRDIVRLKAMFKTNAPEARVVVVANRAGTEKKKTEVPRREFERGIEGQIDFVIPEDAKSQTLSSQSGKPLAVVARSAKITNALREISRELSGKATEVEKAPLWRRLVKR